MRAHMDERLLDTRVGVEYLVEHRFLEPATMPLDLVYAIKQTGVPRSGLGCEEAWSPPPNVNVLLRDFGLGDRGELPVSALQGRAPGAELAAPQPTKRFLPSIFPDMVPEPPPVRAVDGFTATARRYRATWHVPTRLCGVVVIAVAVGFATLYPRCCGNASLHR